MNTDGRRRNDERNDMFVVAGGLRSTSLRLSACICGCLLLATGSATGLEAAISANGWPTCRGDSSRSGSAGIDNRLPRKLSLLWTHRARHAPRPAWSGRDTRMPFDRAYHTVIAPGMPGQTGTLFFGSSADCKVYALDSATGQERWTFFTGGPVRFAPAVWKGRVFVASDDGFLYCLAEGDGRLLWKFRGGPAESLVLGNDRMVSRWPARGGPAIADGVVYFAAGIWPSEGIFIHALDARTGRALWCNDTAGSIYMPQPHPGANARSGVSAQGYLVVAGTRLLVPTGRAVPAVFDRSDGKLLYFHLQANAHRGGSAIVAADSIFFNSGGVFDAASGRLACGGVDTSTVAVTPRHVVHATRSEIVAVDRAKMWTKRQTVDRKGKKVVKTVLERPGWRMKSPHGRARSLIVAGETIVVGGDGRVSVLDMASKKVILTSRVDGVPYGLAAAEGRLFVSTDRGTIYCFGGDAVGKARVVGPKAVAEPYPDKDVYAAAAEEIIRRTGVTEGYCLDLACGDGALAYALAKRTKLQIYAVDRDPGKVAAARRKLDGAGLYGVRVTVHRGDPAGTAYPNYFANLIVSGRSVVPGRASSRIRAAPWPPAAETRRLQRPYGGVVCTGPPGAMKKAVRGELRGAGTWTHQYCDPANTNCSTDTLVAGPLGMLWFTDFGFQMPSRHGRGPAPLFQGGRLFVEGLNALRCIDAYNGRMLWEYPLPGILKAYDQEHLMGLAGTGSNFCVGAKGVYVRVGGKCLWIDPATGRLRNEFEAPRGPTGPGTWGDIRCVGGVLFGTLSDTGHVVKWCYGRSDMREQFTESILLFALDAKTGELKWSYRPQHSIRNNTISIGGGRVYLIDRPRAEGDRLDAKKAPGHPTGTLVALRAADGELVWQRSEDIFGTMLALSEEHGALVMTYQDTRFKLGSEVGGRMAAFRASSGERLWDVKARYGSRPVLNGRTIYAQPGAWDLLTGRKTDYEFSRSYGCGILAGSRNMLVFRSATLGYVDLLGDQGTENYGGIRPGCWINVLPAGGLVLMPDATDRCGCSYLIKASVALQQYGLRPPAISPDGGAFHEPVTATLTVTGFTDTRSYKGACIRYTLDGTSPTASSKRYTRPIKLSKSVTVKARAFPVAAHKEASHRGLPPSLASEASFVIDPDVIPLAGPSWSVYDSPGAGPPKSKWRVADGAVTEMSNIHKGSASDPDPTMERPGTLRIYTPGSRLADGELSLDIACSDDDGLGVAFRFQGPDRYYLWAMDRQRAFHVLALKNGDTYRILAASKRRYQSNRWYELRVSLKGPKITVFLDGEKDLEATDGAFRRGTFALYAWGCAGAKFRNVKWKEHGAR